MEPLHLGVPGAGGSAEVADAALAATVLVVGSALPFAAGALLSLRFRGPPAPLRGFAAGAVAFLFVDLLKQSGLASPPFPFRGVDVVQNGLLAAAFVVGVVAPPLLVRRGRWSAPPQTSAVAFLAAAGVGAHALGEGWIVGTEAHTALLGLPLLGAASFLLHKVLEGAAVGALAEERRSLLPLVLVSAIPAAVGAVAGALLGTLRMGASLAFALGAGASLWMLLTLALRGEGSPRFLAAAASGALGVYLAGLLHAV